MPWAFDDRVGDLQKGGEAEKTMESGGAKSSIISWTWKALGKGDIPLGMMIILRMKFILRMIR